jgi:hypothetical protein
MPGAPVGIADAAEAVGVISHSAVARSSNDITTTTTADPGSGGTSVALTDRTFGGKVGTADANYYMSLLGSSGVREIVFVTSGGGVGAGSLNITRAQMGTTAVAHSVGAKVAKVEWVPRVEPVDASKEVSFRGWFATFDTLGRGGTTGQKLAAIHNATGSTVIVDVSKITVDLMRAEAAGQAPTVLSNKVRAWKFTAVPTNGTVATKVPVDSALSSKSTVTVWQDSSSDGVSSGTPLTVTLPAGTFMVQEYAPRFIVVGTSASTYYEGFDRTTFFGTSDTDVVTLRPLEGLCVYLDYPLATANPITNHWMCSIYWSEYIPA